MSFCGPGTQARLSALISEHAQAGLEGGAALFLGLPHRVPPEGCETLEDLEALLETWDEELQAVGDDAQLANVDMQNMLQRQQQTMQMMSQMSKMLHDTALAVIRKMGG